MKSKTFTRITKVLLLAVLFMMVGVKGWGQTILNFPLTTNNLPTEYTTGNGSAQVLETATGNVAYSSSNGAYVSGWDAGSGSKYWNITSFNSNNLISLTVSFYYRSSATNGPKDFALQYSLNNTSWTTVSSLTFSTTIQQTPTISLPAVCSNQPTLYLRLIMTSNTSIANSTINSSAYTYLKGFVVSGQTPQTPSQASNITFLAITPTTIKVGCSPGNGTNRMIKINTIDAWTNPADNFIPSTSNLTYNGSGEQIIYFGTANSVTVTVPNAYSEYHFRVFEYNYYPNDAVTKFNTTSVTDNPKQCLLESIINPTHENIRLTTALLGGEITTNQSNSISERGICWKTTPGVSITDNPNIEPTDQSGVFTLPVEALPRGTTIYYIAFVSNIAGTSQTVESSFDNTPIFTGTGTWETASRWNVQEVPGENGDATYGSIDDSPIINGTCTQTADNSVTNLTINSGKILNINPDVSLTVNGDLTNNGGTAGLVLKSDATGTGSLMHNTANVNATVQRYISGSSNLFAKKYHLVSVPINAETYLSGVWLDSYLFTYIEATNGWYKWDDPTNNVLQTKEGAMVFYPNWGATTSKTYNISGQLNNGNYLPTITTSNDGYNLIPNPYPSAIDWDAVTQTNVEDAIWIFDPAGPNYVSYAGGVDNGTTNIIPVGQAFFVHATGTGLAFNNEIRTHNYKDFLKSDEIIPNVLHLTIAGNDGRDQIAIRFKDETTAGIDKNFDAAKFYGDLTVPQLSSYTKTESSLLSINSLPTGENETEVPLHLDMDYTGELIYTASGFESFDNSTSIKLEDKQLAQIIDLRTTPTYKFAHTPTDSPERFALHFGSVLDVEKPEAEKLSSITVSSGTIYLNYPASNSGIYASLFDVQGRMIKQVQLSNSGDDKFSISTDGIYILKLSLPSGTETHKIVVR